MMIKSIARVSLPKGLAQFSSQTRNIVGLKETIAATIPSRRKEYKEFKATYGKKVIGETNFQNCLDGGQHIATLFSQYTLFSVDEYDKPPKVFRDFQQHIASSAFHKKYSIESYIWYLLTLSVPTQEQLETFSTDLTKRQQRLIQYDQDHHIFKNIKAASAQVHTEDIWKRLSPMLQASMTFLHYQPQSHFYLNRKDTLRPNHWELILEDLLDIVSIFPYLIYQMQQPFQVPSTHFPGYTEQQHSPTPYAVQLYEAFTIPYRYTSRVYTAEEMAAEHVRKQSRMTDYFLQTMITSGVYPHEYVPRLISCTLSDPYLAISGTCQCYGNWHPQRLQAAEVPIQYLMEDTMILPKGIEHLFWLKWMGSSVGNLVEVWYDRMLMHPLANPKSIDYDTVMHMFPPPIPSSTEPTSE